MKKKDIKKQSKDELSKNIEKLKKDLFNMRFQKINGQIKSTAQVRETKKSLARLKTYYGEKSENHIMKITHSGVVSNRAYYFVIERGLQ